jgi:hypothetical protein
MSAVTVCGPNLPDQSKGDMHVHAAGCADLKRGQLRQADKWTVEVDSVQAVVEAIYSDMIAECDPDEPYGTWVDYEADLYFAPCVHLPRYQPIPCDHPAARRIERVAHGFLNDAPAGTVEVLCGDCGAEVDR